ncbi:BSD domain-containing protein [Dirofilaria immitis]
MNVGIKCCINCCTYAWFIKILVAVILFRASEVGLHCSYDNMKNSENAAEVETIRSDTYLTNDKKEEAEKNIYSFETWATTGSEWFLSAKEKIEQSNSTYAIGWASKLFSISTITDNSWIKAIVDTVKNITQENTIESEDEFTESIYSQIKSISRSDLPHHILYEIQMNLDTYMETTEDDKELFKMWCDDFKLAEYDGKINTLLANCPRVRALYQKMVPEQIESMVFWARYSYKVRQMELLVRYKVEKQLLQDDGNITQGQKWKINFEEKSPNRIERCLNIDKKLAQSQNSLDKRSAMDESWGLCSSTNIDVQELHDENAPRTSKADSNNLSNKGDGWVNWDARKFN